MNIAGSCALDGGSKSSGTISSVLNHPFCLGERVKLFAVGLFFVEGLGEGLFIFWQGGRSKEGAVGGCDVSSCVLLSRGLGYSPVTLDFSAAFGPDLLLRNDT